MRNRTSSTIHKPLRLRSLKSETAARVPTGRRTLAKRLGCIFFSFFSSRSRHRCSIKAQPNHSIAPKHPATFINERSWSRSKFQYPTLAIVERFTPIFSLAIYPKALMPIVHVNIHENSHLGDDVEMFRSNCLGSCEPQIDGSGNCRAVLSDDECMQSLFMASMIDYGKGGLHGILGFAGFSLKMVPEIVGRREHCFIVCRVACELVHAPYHRFVRYLSPLSLGSALGSGSIPNSCASSLSIVLW